MSRHCRVFRLRVSISWMPSHSDHSQEKGVIPGVTDKAWIWKCCCWDSCVLSFAECLTTSDGKQYRGTLSTTQTGKTCQRWDQQTPHIHLFSNPSGFPEASVLDAENFCRWGWRHSNLNPVFARRTENCETRTPVTDCWFRFCALLLLLFSHVIVAIFGCQSLVWLGILQLFLWNLGKWRCFRQVLQFTSGQHTLYEFWFAFLGWPLFFLPCTHMHKKTTKVVFVWAPGNDGVFVNTISSSTRDSKLWNTNNKELD